VWSRRNGLVSDTVRSIWTDADGTVWLGGAPGLQRIRDGRLEVLKGPEGDNRMLFRDGRAVRRIFGNQRVCPRPLAGTGRGLFRGWSRGLPFEEVRGPWSTPWWKDCDVSHRHERRGLPPLRRQQGRGLPGGYFRDHIGTLSQEKAALSGPRRGAARLSRGGSLVRAENLPRRRSGRTQAPLHRHERRRLLRFALRDRKAAGLPDDNVFAILEASRGCTSRRTPIFGFRGPIWIAWKRLDKLPLEIYGLADGLLSVRGTGGSLPQAARAANGTLWFATVRGAAVLDPSKHPPRAAPPNVVVEDARVDGVERPLTDLTLESGPRTLEIAYTAFGFRAPSRMHSAASRVDLTGWMPQPPAFYTAFLPTYRFRACWQRTPTACGTKRRPWRSGPRRH
jgi:hypothetical protein